MLSLKACADARAMPWHFEVCLAMACAVAAALAMMGWILLFWFMAARKVVDAKEVRMLVDGVFGKDSGCYGVSGVATHERSRRRRRRDAASGSAPGSCSTDAEAGSQEAAVEVSESSDGSGDEYFYFCKRGVCHTSLQCSYIRHPEGFQRIRRSLVRILSPNCTLCCRCAARDKRAGL